MHHDPTKHLDDEIKSRGLYKQANSSSIIIIFNRLNIVNKKKLSPLFNPIKLNKIVDDVVAQWLIQDYLLSSA